MGRRAAIIGGRNGNDRTDGARVDVEAWLAEAVRSADWMPRTGVGETAAA